MNISAMLLVVTRKITHVNNRLVHRSSLTQNQSKRMFKIFEKLSRLKITLLARSFKKIEYVKDIN